MFQLQSYLLRDTILGKFNVPSQEGRQKGYDDDKDKESKLATVHDCIDFVTNYVNELAEITNEGTIQYSLYYIMYGVRGQLCKMQYLFPDWLIFDRSDGRKTGGKMISAIDLPTCIFQIFVIGPVCIDGLDLGH